MFYNQEDEENFLSDKKVGEASPDAIVSPKAVSFSALLTADPCLFFAIAFIFSINNSFNR